MNCVQIVGRLTRDPSTRYSNSGTTVTRFNVAVDREVKTQDGQSADFISCVCFGKTADFVEKYFSKGRRIGLRGRIQTGSYQDESGRTVYTTDVIAEHVEFVENKSSSGGNSASRSSESPSQDGRGRGRDEEIEEGFVLIPDDIDVEDLPF